MRMMNRYRQILEHGRDKLKNGGIEDAATDAWLLFEHVFHISRADYYMKQDIPADKKEIDQYNKLIQQRLRNIPLQHLTGTQEFMGFNFKVDANVLIPRQDTETLVELVRDIIDKSMDTGTLRLLDMCTGSGCIAVTLTALCGLRYVTAIDISKEALTIAEENAKNNNVDNIRFIQSDLFENVHEKFDIIVSNPPYIPTKVIEELMPEVRTHEPMMALDGMEDGLFFYERITRDSVEFLKENGMLIYEIGHNQGEAVKTLLRQQGFTSVTVYQDLAGLDRVVIGKRNILERRTQDV